MPAEQPRYLTIAANYFKTNLHDRNSYDAFEISAVRWVHTLKGWNWLTCVRFQDHGHPRTYALFMDNETVIDGHYAVETDACDTQAYAQFDPGLGGRPNGSGLQPLY
jgi:hypothetical protein